MIPDRFAKRPALLALAAAAVAAALAGCGSTVQLQATGTAGEGGLTVPGSSQGGLAAATDGVGSGPARSRPAIAPGAAAAGSAASAAARQGAGEQAPQPLTAGDATAAGVASKEPIRVGVIYTPGVDQAAAAMGISALQTGDTRAEAEAVVKWIGEHGGLGGHPVKLFSYAMDMSANSPAQAQQEACTAMTQDYKVRFVVAILANVGVLAQCLANAGVGLLDDETGLGDAAMAKYANFLGNPGEFAPGRMETNLVEDLWRRGWLTSQSTVGILADDGADGHAIVEGPLAAALHRHGLTATTQYVNPRGGDGGSAQSSSAALRFRSAGVDRIIPVLYNPLFLMEAASSQGYHPAYAMYSTNGPGALLESTAPRDQLVNAAGIGWQPFLDIGSGTKPPPVSKRETLCFALARKAGQDMSSATVKGFAVQVCNVLFYLKDLSDRLPSMPPDLLTAGRMLIGRTFVSADTFRTDVTHRTDGAAGYRSLAYQQDCSCFQYVSQIRTAS